MPINAIVFDMDDTLYREKDYIISGLKAVSDWVEKKYNITGFYEAAVHYMNTDHKSFVFNRALEKLQADYDEELIRELVERYRFHPPDIHLFEDAEWVLNHLANTVKLGLISDGYLASQEKKVSALRLQERFESIILTDRYGKEHWKPSPVPYEQTSRELQVPHHQCVYIGDNVKKDFITAKSLGWITIHIDRKDGVYSDIAVEPEYQAHYKIDDLRKLSEVHELKHLFLASSISA